MELPHCSVGIGFLCNICYGVTDNEFQYVFIYMIFFRFYESALVLVMGHVGPMLSIIVIKKYSLAGEKRFSMRGWITDGIVTIRFFPVSVYLSNKLRDDNFSEKELRRITEFQDCESGS